MAFSGAAAVGFRVAVSGVSHFRVACSQKLSPAVKCTELFVDAPQTGS